MTTTPSHPRVERGTGCRPANSQRGTSSFTWDEPSTSSLQCGSCEDDKGGPNRSTRRRSLSSSPGGLLPRGPHQNRTRRFPPSGSSADVAHGDAPQIRTRIRGTRSTTFRISGDMSPDVNAPVMGPFERSHQHGPPLCSAGSGGQPVPRRPRSYAALRLPPSRRPRLRSSLAGGLPCPSCDKEEDGPPRCLGRPLPACRRLRPRWVRVSACPSRRDRQRLQAAQCPGHPE